jgi:hypothetical protein
MHVGSSTENFATDLSANGLLFACFGKNMTLIMRIYIENDEAHQ